MPVIACYNADIQNDEHTSPAAAWSIRAGSAGHQPACVNFPCVADLQSLPGVTEPFPGVFDPAGFAKTGKAVAGARVGCQTFSGMLAFIQSRR